MLIGYVPVTASSSLLQFLHFAGFVCPTGAQNIGETKKWVTCSAFYKEVNYGKRGTDFTYNTAAGCIAAGQDPNVRSTLQCAAASASSGVLTDNEIMACANKLCMRLGAAY